MKIFSVEQIRAWDAYTIENELIASVELMNRAAAALVDWLAGLFAKPDQPVLCVCGTGNNGGDGVAAARLLNALHFDAKVLVCDFAGKRSADFEAQIQRLPQHGAVPVQWLKIADDLPQLAENVLVVDALFGSGLTREPSGEFAKIIEWMNALSNTVVSIDLPSGLFADRHTPGLTVEADRTFSFEQPKLAFFFPENARRVGEWAFGSIGLSPDFQANTPTDFHFLTSAEAARLRRPRRRFDHKGTFGHALLAAGSIGKMGAATLAARACLRAGAGLLTVHVPRCGVEILQNAAPEAMCSTDAVTEMWTTVPDLSRFVAVGVGPGIGTGKPTERALENLLKKAAVPLVLDADALNLLAQNPAWWAFLPTNSVLTPHTKEFERLFGTTENDFARLDLQRKMAREHGVFIVLKGAHSAIACPDGEVWFNSTGNPGMATGGSGDALTGILTGLLAQGYEPKDAARLGVFLHGLAGDLAATERSEEALVAGDLVDFLGRAWLKIRSLA